MTTSAIICTRNRIDDLTAALSSLSAQTSQPTEIIIVDSSTTPLETNPKFNEIFSKNIFKNSKIIYTHTKPGLTIQRNVGIKRASSNIIYFFDDDVILQKNYIEEMNKIYISNQKFAGGMGSVTNLPPPSSMLYKLFRKFFLLQTDYSSGNFRLSGMPTHAYGTNKFKDSSTPGKPSISSILFSIFLNTSAIPI